MTEVHVSDTIAAPAEKVWAQMSDFGGIGETEIIEKCELEGEGIGAVRTLTLKGGRGVIRERLEAFDPANRSFSYSIIGECPLPVQNYFSTVRISAEGEKAARVDWTGRFEPKGAPEEEAKKLIAGVYKSGIERTCRRLGIAAPA